MFLHMLSVVALVAYLILFWKTTARVIKGVFRSDVVLKIGKGLKLPFPRAVLGLILLLICGVVGYVLAPVLWAAYRYHDRKVVLEKQRRSEERRVQAERLRAERQVENKKRARLQEEWFAKNPRKLFINTMSGVTAVLCPSDLALGERATRHAMLDGTWRHKNILRPTGSTYFFVTVEGQLVVKKHFGDGVATRMLSELHDLAERYDVELVRDFRIFVPGTSEVIIPFDKQAQEVLVNMNRRLFDFLIASQIPQELKLLPEY